MSQHSLQEPSQDPPKPSKSDELSSFFWFSLVLARSPPRSKKSHQDPPKSARKLPILGSKFPSAPSWPHLGAKLANLAPSWPQLGPSWRQDVLQQASGGSPEHVPISTLGHLGARRLTKSLQPSPGPLFFHVFASILVPILSKVVENVLENFCFILALSVPCQTRSHTPPPKRGQDEAKMDSRCLS